jgi:hypothetical protein
VSERKHARSWVLGAALLGSLAWSFWLPGQDDATGADVVQAVPHRENVGRTALAPAPEAPPGGGATPAALDAAPEGLDARPAAPARARNLFAEYSFEPPRPKALPTAPEAPQAPQLPFRYAGRLVIGGVATYLLIRGEDTVSLALGEQANEFQLVAATPQLLTFLHGPTGQRVSLVTAEPGKR